LRIALNSFFLGGIVLHWDTNRVLLLPAATQGLVELDQSDEFVRLGLRQS
jgi:hypothetical protein